MQNLPNALAITLILWVHNAYPPIVFNIKYAYVGEGGGLVGGERQRSKSLEFIFNHTSLIICKSHFIIPYAHLQRVESVQRLPWILIHRHSCKMPWICGDGPRNLLICIGATGHDGTCPSL